MSTIHTSSQLQPGSYCGDCGAYDPSNALFCGSCGTPRQLAVGIRTSWQFEQEYLTYSGSDWIWVGAVVVVLGLYLAALALLATWQDAIAVWLLPVGSGIILGVGAAIHVVDLVLANTGMELDRRLVGIMDRRGVLVAGFLVLGAVYVCAFKSGFSLPLDQNACCPNRPGP